MSLSVDTMAAWTNRTRKGCAGLAAPVQPLVLAQRWIEFSFVGFLPPHAVMFIWDQCFLHANGWPRLLGTAGQSDQ
jgi:hypothetical protein